MPYLKYTPNFYFVFQEIPLEVLCFCAKSNNDSIVNIENNGQLGLVEYTDIKAQII